MTVTQLNVYPIKSLGGISLSKLQLTDRGFELDRQWMLIDETGTSFTQREDPRLSLFKVMLKKEGLEITFNGDSILLPYHSNYLGETITTEMFGNSIQATLEAPILHEWFSDQLNQHLRLVRPSMEFPRFVKKHPGTVINFPDSSQYLILGQQSLDFLNDKLRQPIPMNRFRPNIVFEGGKPHEEDQWSSLKIGAAKFEVVKPCARCQITTIDQSTGEVSKEPLKTLSTYRRQGQKVLFGQYLKLVSTEDNILSIGDEIDLMA